MSPKKVALLQIVLALGFAAVMLGAEQIFGEQSEWIRNLLIAVWWVPFSYLCVKGSRPCCSKRNHEDGC